jgi:precorrin-4 C11-methyltransferase
MKIAVIQISETGHPVAQRLIEELHAHLFTLHEGMTPEHWNTHDAFVFIGAMGICVRSIAPYLRDKHTDPAVVCVDSLGEMVVSVLSGHIGGANELTHRIAGLLGAMPVVTTQSDRMGLWALDMLAGRFEWTVVDERMNHQIARFTNCRPTALLLDIRDKGTDWMEANLPDHVKVFYHLDDIPQQDYELLLAVSPFQLHNITIPCLQYIPRCVHLGIGLAHQAQPVDDILREMMASMTGHDILSEAVADYSTICEKKDEPVVKALQAQGETVHFYEATQLKDVEVPNPSATVEKYMSTASVSEASALLSSRYGRLLMSKQKGEKWTLAAALDVDAVRQGHIEIVGAGPGDPDLVSVRGRRMLEHADLILYAGSLVPRELTDCAKAGATVRSSADMDLQEQCQLMKTFYDQGKYIVRLHTGDPCIFGAIQEQMAYFDQHNMHYHITPGISSFLAAAAELRSQFTIPERVQTIILTRGEGRTPMPEREKLHLLARSQSTMCIFLSAAIVDKVQQELLMEYPEETPVAACYHLTWGDQRIYRGQLKDLAKIVKDHHLTLTTMLVVGEAIDNRSHESKLYDRHFTHLFRQGK